MSDNLYYAVGTTLVAAVDSNSGDVDWLVSDVAWDNSCWMMYPDLDSEFFEYSCQWDSERWRDKTELTFGEIADL